jgi:SAM-dependent methyltransferase
MNQPSATPEYWENRYQTQDTPWDIGHASPALIHYASKQGNKDTRILIPGAGHAYEAVWLHEHGFRQVYVCDWAPSAFEVLRAKAPGFPEEQLLVGDFFGLEGTFDLMLEQTFFSAIQPDQREAYAKKAQELLQPEGRLAGVLFAHPFEHQGPPFGATQAEYRSLFEPHFHILHLDIATDSIKPREGRELFVELQARSQL